MGEFLFHGDKMTILPVIILLFLPMLLANTTNAFSLMDMAKWIMPLTRANNNFRQEMEALISGNAELLKQYRRFLRNIRTEGVALNPDFAPLRQKILQECPSFLTDATQLLKRRNEFEDKFWQSDLVFPDEYASDFRIETLNKSLTIHQNPSLLMLSRKSSKRLTGYMVWDSAPVVAKYLEVTRVNKSWTGGQKILDLGAGTGYVGIVAACLGGDVTLADVPAMIPFIQKNIDANHKLLAGGGGEIRTQVLRWGDAEDVKPLPKQDIIILSGLAYDDQLVKKLIQTVVALSDKSTQIVVCEDKWTHSDYGWGAFLSLAGEYFELDSIPKSLVDIGPESPDVWFMRGHLRQNLC